MGKVKQKSVLGNSFVFWRKEGKVINIIGVLTEKEIELINTNPDELTEEQIIRINKVMEELKKNVD